MNAQPYLEEVERIIKEEVERIIKDEINKINRLKIVYRYIVI